MAGSGKRKKSPVTVRGPWIPFSTDFLRSRLIAELSPHAVKMLFALCGQLGYNATGNGDISAAPAILRPLGWTGKATIAAALAELERAGLLCLTRQGSRGRCSLYAITLWPMDCDFRKLDHGPGCYAAEGWRTDAAQRDAPTSGHPAKWNRPRKNTSASPAMGEAKADLPPLRGNVRRGGAAITPATGASALFFGPKVPPPRDTFLDKPSPVSAVGLLVGNWDMAGETAADHPKASSPKVEPGSTQVALSSRPTAEVESDSIHGADRCDLYLPA